MNKEIKQRFEQLNNGKIPKGYKKTDFGVFPSDWVTDKKLIDIGNFGKGKGIPGNKMLYDGVPCVGYGDIYMKYNHFHFEEAQSFVDEETAKDSQIIKKGTLLFTGTGETAEEIGKCICYNGDSTIYAGGDIITFVPQDVNPLFLAYQQYQNFSLKKKASFGQGHSVVHIQKESLEKLNVAYPESKKEQSRIVEILMKWDKAIELYDKQIDALTRYKAVCLRKMFPAKGQNVPEWRFRGFSGNWEQRKLGDISDSYSGGTPSAGKIEYYGGTIPFIRSAEINSDFTELFLTEEGLMNSSAKMINKGDILYALYGATSGEVGLARLDGAINQAILDIKPHVNYDSKYLLQWLRNSKDNIIRTYLQGGQGNLSGTIVAALMVDCPTFDEQKKIGAFFAYFDNLITLHQRKKETIINQTVGMGNDSQKHY